MKTIVCFITSLSSGGAERQLIELVKSLMKHFDVTIVTFSDIADHYDVDGRIKRIRLGFGKSSIGKVWAILRYFLTVKTDCVLSFGQRENMYALFPLLFRKDVKVIVGERNFTKLRPMKYEYVLFNFLYRRADYIVSNSYSQKEYILKKKPQYKDKVKVITNYTDTEVYKCQAYPNNVILRIGVFARYTKQKNYIRFAEAIRLLNEKTRIPFVVEWYGNQHMKDSTLNPDFVEFEKLVKEYHLLHVLKLNDHVKNVNDLMKEFDAICLPSLYEGFSNSISEAICCGKPMLVSNVSDNSLMVKDGENGFLFNPEEPNDIANSFIKFLSLNKEDRLKMAHCSREIALKLFDKSRFVESYERLIL